MRRPARLHLALAAAAAAALAGAAPAAAHSPSIYRACGDTRTEGSAIYSVTAKRVGCESARKIARGWVRKVSPDSTVIRVREFRCTDRRNGPESLRVVCTRSANTRVVRFFVVPGGA